MDVRKAIELIQLRGELEDATEAYDILARDHDMLVDRVKLLNEHVDKLNDVIARKNAILLDIVRIVALDGLLDRTHRERNETCKRIVLMVENDPVSDERDEIPF